VLVGGRISGRKERDRGQMGVSRMEGWVGWISGPEAEREYAVEPVGVERIRPSAWVLGLSAIRRDLGEIKGHGYILLLL